MEADRIFQASQWQDRKAWRNHPPHRIAGSTDQERLSDTPWPSQHTVLVIDDEAEVLRNIHDLLRPQYRLVGTTQPHVGLEIMRQRPIQIVIADQRMPALSGIEFLKHIRVEHPEAVRLLFTDSADMKPARDAINSGQIYRYISKPWDSQDLQTIVRQAAEHHDLLMRCKRLAHELRAANEEAKTANADMLQACDAALDGWSRALELRDEQTDGHCRRVSELTVQLARAMGIEGSQLQQVRRGALLHDIGKVAIPDSILVKPGPLTEEEWAIMKRHTCYGYELLARIPFLQEALDIPYCHHERWDGTGYPRGLRGEEIPLAARIFAVIDVWDALCSDRSYRKAWPEEEARAYIQSLAGTQFDPNVVETFSQLVF
ncbi:MAG TPA: HD domain-containing phosphohydrolase [Gemmataceae bacterium]|nr:HD domain-containing phosphohydrolase [Gemmataceae bacterium]